MRFRKKELPSVAKGLELMQKIIEHFGENVKVEEVPVLKNRLVSMILLPIKKKI